MDVVRDEYAYVYGAIKWLRRKWGRPKAGDYEKVLSWLREVRISVGMRGLNKKTLHISRPVPVPENSLEGFACRFVDVAERPSTLASFVLSKRLPMSDPAKKLEMPKKRASREPSGVQKLLASAFLDLSVQGDNKVAGDLVRKILDTLFRSNYSRILGYYMVQIAHRLEGQLTLGSWAARDIVSLCRSVTPSEQNRRMVSFDEI